jgi:hypothetical protein
MEIKNYKKQWILPKLNKNYKKRLILPTRLKIASNENHQNRLKMSKED